MKFLSICFVLLAAFAVLGRAQLSFGLPFARNIVQDILGTASNIVSSVLPTQGVDYVPSQDENVYLDDGYQAPEEEAVEEEDPSEDEESPEDADIALDDPENTENADE